MLSYFSQKNIAWCITIISTLFALSACQYSPKTPSPSAKISPPATPQRPVVSATPDSPLTPTTYQALPHWADDVFSEVWPAFMHSCAALKNKAKWKTVCAKAQYIPKHSDYVIKQFFEKHFTPYQVQNTLADNTGLLTGYYEPLLIGARYPHQQFNTPLHATPDDLLTIQLAENHPELKNLRLRGRLSGNKVVPYYSRAEITASESMKKKVILWVDDPVDAFFLQIQGSGRVTLKETGEMVRLSFADTNGLPYKSIGRHLIKTEELAPHQASAQGIKNWVKAHPEKMADLFNQNPRYVFFKEEKLLNPQLGPKGALGVPLTAERSIAVDRRLIPLGAPVFISASGENAYSKIHKLTMAQDVGGAIKGAVRADYFTGTGNKAGNMAGKMKQKLNMWVLLPSLPPPTPPAN